MNKETIKKRYAELLHEVKTSKFYEVKEKRRTNVYTCQSCGHNTKTVDIDAGVTPFAFSCEKCKKSAFSNFYANLLPDMDPTFEWYRPSLKELLTINDQETIGHVLKGGLLPRKIKQINT